MRRIVEKMIDQFEEESDKLLFDLGPTTCRNWAIDPAHKITANRDRSSALLNLDKNYKDYARWGRDNI